MEAIYLKQYGNSKQAFEKRTLELSEPSEGQVQIKVVYSGLNYADVMARKGMYKAAPAPPSILGYDVGGTIAKIGKGVSEEWLGKKVIALTRFGGYASFVNTSINGLVEVPNNLSLEDAMPLTTQGVTAYLATHFCLHVLKNDVALVHAAAGGVGQMLVKILKSKGAYVIGVVGSEQKIGACKNNGCDEVLLRKDYFLQSKQKKVKPIDLIFNAAGGKLFRTDVKNLNKGGRIVAFGAAERSQKGIFGMLKLVLNFGFYSPIPFIMKSNSLVGLNVLALGDEKPFLIQESLNGLVKMVKDGIIVSKVGHIFKADDIAEAHEIFEKGASQGKILLNWE